MAVRVRSSRRRRRKRTNVKAVFRRWRKRFTAFRKRLASYPPTAQFIIIAILGMIIWGSANWTYHAINKPTELFFPLDDVLDKSLSQTWREYGALFRAHSTADIPPELLAALAQVEGGGNPVARTFWRWQMSWNPFEVYQPASSAVGMFQITDGTFREARRYCVHDHVVVEDGPWNDPKSCWFNSLYMRVLPTHAIEMTSALLDRSVANALRFRRKAPLTPARKQNLAAVIHLCGASVGKVYAARGFQLLPDQRCGSHSVAAYLAKVNRIKQQFAKMNAVG